MKLFPEFSLEPPCDAPNCPMCHLDYTHWIVEHDSFVCEECEETFHLRYLPQDFDYEEERRYQYGL